MRWSYLPPLMVYLAAGVSGFTGIIESFFIKDNLGLSAAFLAGLAFWAVGIDGSVFWGAVMTFLSVIPAVGSALVWVPAVIILSAMGHYLKALLLLIFCGLLVGSMDNLLRPKMVGRDTRMHELLIFFI